MIGFVLGVLVGFGAKMAYDFFQEERIPTDLGMAQGRAEAMMDETRQIVREIRDELRSAAVATKESVADKAGRLQGVASTPPPQGTNPPAASTGAARSGPSTTSPAATAAAPETFGAAEAGPTKGSASSTTGASASPSAERTSTESSGTAARSTSSQSASTHDRPDNGGSSKPSGQSKKDGDD